MSSKKNILNTFLTLQENALAMQKNVLLLSQQMLAGHGVDVATTLSKIEQIIITFVLLPPLPKNFLAIETRSRMASCSSSTKAIEIEHQEFLSQLPLLSQEAVEAYLDCFSRDQGASYCLIYERLSEELKASLGKTFRRKFFLARRRRKRAAGEAPIKKAREVNTVVMNHSKLVQQQTAIKNLMVTEITNMQNSTALNEAVVRLDLLISMLQMSVPGLSQLVNAHLQSSDISLRFSELEPELDFTESQNLFEAKRTSIFLNPSVTWATNPIVSLDLDYEET